MAENIMRIMQSNFYRVKNVTPEWILQIDR